MTTQLPAIVLEKIAIREENDCWEWLACKNAAGYGEIRVNWKHWLAHRYVYSLVTAEIPDGLIVLHTCDNPGCVNPKHLILGTHLHNVRDKEAKGRANHFTKLSEEEEVREIRTKYTGARGELASLGRLYGVNRSCVYKIVNNHLRKNVL